MNSNTNATYTNDAPISDNVGNNMSSLNTTAGTQSYTTNPVTGNSHPVKPAVIKPVSSSEHTGTGTTNPVKGAFAAVHGAGEALRGTFNGTVDNAFSESGGVTKNNHVTAAGIDEMETGRFAHGTKTREGVVPVSE